MTIKVVLLLACCLPARPQGLTATRGLTIRGDPLAWDSEKRPKAISTRRGRRRTFQEMGCKAHAHRETLHQRSQAVFSKRNALLRGRVCTGWTAQSWQGSQVSSVVDHGTRRFPASLLHVLGTAMARCSTQRMTTASNFTTALRHAPRGVL